MWRNSELRMRLVEDKFRQKQKKPIDDDENNLNWLSHQGKFRQQISLTKGLDDENLNGGSIAISKAISKGRAEERAKVEAKVEGISKGIGKGTG